MTDTSVQEERESDHIDDVDIDDIDIHDIENVSD